MRSSLFLSGLSLEPGEARLNNRQTMDAVPLRGVGEDDEVALAQSFENFDGVDRAAAELDGDADGRAAPLLDAEEADARLRATRSGPADVEDVLQTLELDRAVHAQVGARAR